MSSTPIIYTLFCKHVSLKDYFHHLNIDCDNISSSLKKVYKKIIICAQHDGQLYPENTAIFKREFSTEELIHHVIEHLLKLSKSKHVLTLGYRFISERFPADPIRGTMHVRMTSFNSIVMYLKNKCWEEIHKILGDDLLFYMLTSTFIFLSIPNKCFVQLTGTLISEPIKFDLTHVKNCKFSNKTKVCKPTNSKTTKHSDLVLSSRRSVKRKSTSTIAPPNKKMKINDTFNEPLCFQVKHGKSPARKIIKPSKKASLNANLVKTLNVTYIRRSQIFYSSFLIDSLGKNFILNCTPASNLGALALAKSIFQFKTSKNRLPKHLIAIGKLLKSFIGKYKKIRFNGVLNSQCALPKWFKVKKCKIKDDLKKYQFQIAVQSFVPPQKVFLFVRFIMKKLLQEFFVGCENNLNKLLLAIKRVVFLGRYEKLSIEKILVGMKISQFQWLPSFNSQKKCLQQSIRDQKIIKTFFLWLFNSFILPLLRAFFYVTETSCHRNTVFYYRKPIWNVILKHGLQSVMGNVYQPMSKGDVEAKLKDKECLGVYDIRFVPGQNKIRPIANMSKCFNDINKINKIYLNYLLKPVHLCLHYEVANNPASIGATVTHSNQAYTRWLSFVSTIKQRFQAIPDIYFVSLDISRCFDTLPQDELLKLIPSLLKEDSYVIRRFTKIQISANGHVSKRRLQLVTNGYNCENSIQFLGKKLQKGVVNCKNTIFVDQVYTSAYTHAHLIELVRKHISCSIGRLQDNYIIQSQGLPQGSILASLLNNLHYGNIEQNELRQYFNSQDSILMRWVDDYFFATLSKSTATEFIANMNDVMTRHGCILNMKKTLVNFNHVVNGHMLRCTKGDLITWCGYLINTKTLEFHFNYLQYVGDSLRGCMTLEYSVHPALSMVRKLLQATSVKATPLIVDDGVNSKESIHLNIYQAFRFVDETIKHELSFYMDTIYKLSRRFYISCRNNFLKSFFNPSDTADSSTIDSNKSSLSGRSRSKLDENLIYYLCLQAFIDTLRPKSTTYNVLVARLVNQIKLLKGYDVTVDMLSIREKSTYFKMIKT